MGNIRRLVYAKLSELDRNIVQLIARKYIPPVFVLNQLNDNDRIHSLSSINYRIKECEEKFKLGDVFHYSVNREKKLAEAMRMAEEDTAKRYTYWRKGCWGRYGSHEHPMVKYIGSATGKGLKVTKQRESYCLLSGSFKNTGILKHYATKLAELEFSNTYSQYPSIKNQLKSLVGLVPNKPDEDTEITKRRAFLGAFLGTSNAKIFYIDPLPLFDGKIEESDKNLKPAIKTEKLKTICKALNIKIPIYRSKNLLYSLDTGKRLEIFVSHSTSRKHNKPKIGICFLEDKIIIGEIPQRLNSNEFPALFDNVSFNPKFDKLDRELIMLVQNQEERRRLRNAVGLEEYIKAMGDMELLDMDSTSTDPLNKRCGITRALMRDAVGESWMICSDGSTGRVYTLFAGRITTCSGASQEMLLLPDSFFLYQS